MKLLEYEELQRMVDYSFGDHSGTYGGVPNAYMKKANSDNEEFKKFCKNFIGKKMTLFIDNIRLYNRQINFSDWEKLKPITPTDRKVLDNYKNEDLLKLCSEFPDITFVIFTAFEDTPIDEHIEGRIPNNVESINATNSVYLNEKIFPMPHGIERIMHSGYNNHKILKNFIEQNTEASKLLYVSHRDDTGSRIGLKEMLSSFATVTKRVNYQHFLTNIKDHKFVLCPSGNGIGSARNWETLYLKRVPVLEYHKYKEAVFKDFPDLFIDSYKNLTKEILEENNHLYEEAKKIDMNKLDLDFIFKQRI
jgi:hypothetical protein